MKRLLILATILVSFIFAGIVQAGVAAPPGSLEYLSGQAESIQAGDKIFDTWWYSLGVDGVGGDLEGLTEVFPDPNYIMVEPLNDGGLDPGPGLRFTTPTDTLYVSGGEYMHLQIGFRVTTLGDLLIKDNTLRDGGASVITNINDTGYSIYETVEDPAGVLLAEKYIEFSFTDDALVTDLFDSASFPPTSMIYVTKDILLWAVDIDANAKLNAFEQRFSQTAPVPEPATMFLLGTGLVGVAGAARRRKKK